MTFVQLKEKVSGGYTIRSYKEFIDDYHNISISYYENKLKVLEEDISKLLTSFTEKSDTVEDLKEKADNLSIIVN